MFSVCITLTDFVLNFSFTVTTVVPMCLWVRMVRGTEGTCTKAGNICLLLPKQNTKNQYNNWKCISLWWNVFSALHGCATVHTEQTEVINHTHTDFVQKQKPACATQHLVKQQNIFSRLVHTDSSLIWWWITTTWTSFNFMLKSVDSLNRDSKNTGHEEDRDNLQKDKKGSLASSTYIDPVVAEILDSSHFFKNQNM